MEREPFRDSRLDQSVRVPLTALAHMKDIDEIVDDEGRVRASESSGVRDKGSCARVCSMVYGGAMLCVSHPT